MEELILGDVVMERSALNAYLVELKEVSLRKKSNSTL